MFPDYYEFQHNTKIVSGRYSLENLAAELRQLGVKKPLLLSDEGLVAAGIVRQVTDAVENNGMKWAAVYTDIPRDSSLDVVNKIAVFYHEKGCDALVAVGGGSVIDTAKGAKMVLSLNVKDIRQLAGCECICRGRRIPFAAIPTTSGTGSESTLVAVIRDELRRQKLEYISYELQPDLAVLDPRTTITLPPLITAATGIDALCHAVEAFTCMQKNPVSDAYAAAAIRLVRDNLVKAVRFGSSVSARMSLANASYLAGAAFSNSMVGVVHAIGHALGGVCQVPHGDAMNILLPAGMIFNKKACRETYSELLLYLAGPEVYQSVPKADRANRSIHEVIRLRKKLHDMTGLPSTLKEAGVDPAKFPEVAKAALNDGSTIANPREVTCGAVMNILEMCYGE